MQIEEVIRTIEMAFDGVPPPEELTLHAAEAHDDWGYDNDALHRKKDHTGRWQDVPDEHLYNCQHALSYLDKVGMRYYLPAFMSWYLRGYTDQAKVPLDNALYALDPHSGDPRLQDYHKERFSLFNDEQMAACAAFVRYCAEEPTGMADNRFAYDIYFQYWNRYDRD